jgi:hypothetical protein
MSIDYAAESARYGNLARVAIGFYVSTGNRAEQDAAVCYTNAAVYFAGLALAGTQWDAPSSTCIEHGSARLSFQIRVF